MSQSHTQSLVYESDWLGSRPCFYNVRTGRAGHNINDVVDLANIEFDPEGFNDYLDFGFCVFEHTPLRDVRMLRYSSRLFSGPDGFRVEYLDDPAEEWLDHRSTVDEVLELASAKINAATANLEAEIVVPTSGGFDSRFINVLLADRKRVRAFTYGVSDEPARSVEAVKAAELARRLGLHWELIPLGSFHRYFDEWDALFGISTHAHGMYHIEFYREIHQRVSAGSVVVSGSCGERFAGDDADLREVGELRDPADVYRLFRWEPGSMNADSRYSSFRSERVGAAELLESTPRIRTEVLPRVVVMERLRIVLLSYLLSVPASLGFLSTGPYLDIDLAMRMLTLPDDLRRDRRWQREFFARQGVDLEATAFPVDWRNTLNFRAMREVPLEPLSVSVLREVVKPDYVRWINRTVGPLGLASEVLWRLGWVPGLRRGVSVLARTGITHSRQLAYNAYLTLKPIESLLLRRERVRSGEEVP